MYSVRLRAALLAFGLVFAAMAWRVGPASAETLADPAYPSCDSSRSIDSTTTTSTTDPTTTTTACVPVTRVVLADEATTVWVLGIGGLVLGLVAGGAMWRMGNDR